jgi:hypothetical protein
VILLETMTLTLSEKHLQLLRDGSGIGDEVVAARGYRTITDEADLLRLGFASTNAGCQDCSCRCTPPTARWVQPSTDQTIPA